MTAQDFRYACDMVHSVRQTGGHMSLSQLPAEILKLSFKFTAIQVFCMSRCCVCLASGWGGDCADLLITLHSSAAPLLTYRAACFCICNSCNNLHVISRLSTSASARCLAPVIANNKRIVDWRLDEPFPHYILSTPA